MGVFKCINHGEFENAKASLRAFCPQCGRNCRRVFGKTTVTSDVQNNDNEQGSRKTSEPTGGAKPVSTNDSPVSEGTGEHRNHSEQPNPEIRVTKRIRVKIAKKKPEKTTQSVVKKKTITGVAKPQIKVKVKTNREKKLNKTEKTSSQWSKVKKVSGWPL
jgi:polygalacturonase